MASLASLKKAAASLTKYALTYPEAVEDFPWGHSAIKVQRKIFLSTYLDPKTATLSLSVKLPVSGAMALTFPFAAPTGYGLGKSGWVTSTFDANAKVPIAMVKEWIDESYRAVAPRRLVASLDQAEAL